MLHDFIHEFLPSMKEVALALLPMAVVFAVFQAVALKMKRRQLLRMSLGMLFTLVGLTLFLVGVNVGFAPAGDKLGRVLASLDNDWILLPVGVVLGIVVVFAEPAVHVLNREVEQVSGGYIKSGVMLLTLSLGTAIAVGLAMLRVITGISLWYFLIPGYAVGLTLMFFAPPLFTGIAFDSGGVATGPMTATFVLPLAIGAATFIDGRNPLFDAFGTVALVAMMPIIGIQVLGLIYKAKTKRTQKALERLEIVDTVLVNETSPAGEGEASNE